MTQIIINIDSPPDEETGPLPPGIQQQMAYVEYSRAVFGIRQELCSNRGTDTKPRHNQGTDTYLDDTGD